jgi:hypothetical protein
MHPNTLLKIALAATVSAAVGLALLPDRMHVSRSAVVHGSPAEVVHLVSHFPTRRGWVAWSEIDPAAAYTFSGEPGTPGATMSWDGEVIGRATLTLTSLDTHEVTPRLDYEAPFAMQSTDHFAIEDLGDGTSRVTWSALADLPYGPGRLFGLFADSELGPDYERGLERLDALLSTRS